MPPLSLAEPSGHYLPFPKREELLCSRRRAGCPRDRPGTQAGPGHDLARAAAQRRDPQRQARVPGHRGAVEGAGHRAATQAGEAGEQPVVSRVRADTAERTTAPSRRDSCRRPPTTWKGLNKPHRADHRWATAWSPEQISRRLVVDFPDHEDMRISHEAIYQALYIQGRGALKRELVACLRTGWALRKPRERSRNRSQGHVTADVVLSERPAEVEDRAVPGHWEATS